MPRRKFIDKKNATTFQLVHRAQNDPLIHDENASSMVFKEIGAGNTKVKTRDDLESEFGSNVRKNEGEAANYGVYFDDTSYDYMQHMRDLGAGGGVFVEVEEGKKKNHKNLESALRDMALDDTASEGGISLSSTASSRAEEYFDASMLPSEFVQRKSYQDQQNVPDAIAGFQPDMDPRLREVLEALDDEAYVEDDEADVFGELTAGGADEEMDPLDWEEQGYWEEDDGWESDVTVKASERKETDTVGAGEVESDFVRDENLEPGADPNPQADGDWMAEFSKFKKDQKSGKAPAVKPVDVASSVKTGTSSLLGGRRKKRKGALTDTSSYSMSSSSIYRTDQHTLLDARFDKIEEEYADDGFPEDGDDNASLASGMTGLSKMSGMSRVSVWSTTPSEAPKLTSQFNGIMDDFLGSHNRTGKTKRRVRKGAPLTGLEQLDEIRNGLGPARVKAGKA